MLRIFYVRNLYLLPIALAVFFYVFPAMIDITLTGSIIAFELILLTAFAFFWYIFGYFILSNSSFSSVVKQLPKLKVSWKMLSFLIIVSYLAVILYASFTTPKIALFEAFRGVSMSELSELREAFLRTRSGWEIILLYWYAISIACLMPLVIAYKFYIKDKYRFIILLTFLFTLFLTLEKGRALVALFPLIILFVNTGYRRVVYKVGLFLIFTIVVVSFIARGGVSEPGIDQGNLQGVPDKYNLFSEESGQTYYLINRVVYIPYVTALDWLNFRHEKLHGELLYGQSIGVIASLTGQDKFHLERKVFEYQWGQNESGTGSSNTIYYIDAYLNFGLIGIALYSIVLAFIVRCVVVTRHLPLIVVLGISMYYVVFHSFTAVLFSGGLLFLLLLALFFKLDYRSKKY